MSRGKELVDQFWEDGYTVQLFRDHRGVISEDKIEMSEYEYLHDEPDPDDNGKYYTEWMPKYGGRQPDDDD